ncbi:MAG: aminotransferase class V-fold PLP-dependent enzyme, partial [Actinobacteria bacterium]|nr:aminotransferase class V-fold PLP-dependent enzyme [Actinomycetota bacterium]
NLSALIAARWQWRQRGRGAHARVRPIILASGGAHSSVALAANAMDADLVAVPTDYANRLMASDVRASYDAMSAEDRVRVCAVVATAGTTNLGVIDDLAGIGAFAREKNVWFHVDGAYGAAALCARSSTRREDDWPHTSVSSPATLAPLPTCGDERRQVACGSPTYEDSPSARRQTCEVSKPCQCLVLCVNRTCTFEPRAGIHVARSNDEVEQHR